jgi:nucleoside-diphosphate-sugar epimerase
MERAVDRAGEAGLSTVTLMPGGCIGPGDLRLGTGSVIAGVVRGLLPWWVDGLVNIIDVGDVARAHVAAAAPTAHDRYALGGHALRVPEFLHRIKDRFGGSVPTLELSADDARARAHADELAAAPSRERVAVPREFVDMVTMGQRVSNARAEADLGLTLTPLDDALDRAYAFLSRFGFVPRLATKGNVDEHARY